jgi:hypothetical protein
MTLLRGKWAHVRERLAAAQVAFKLEPRFLQLPMGHESPFPGS